MSPDGASRPLVYWRGDGRACGSGGPHVATGRGGGPFCNRSETDGGRCQQPLPQLAFARPALAVPVGPTSSGEAKGSPTPKKKEGCTGSQSPCVVADHGPITPATAAS